MGIGLIMSKTSLAVTLVKNMEFSNFLTRLRSDGRIQLSDSFFPISTKYLLISSALRLSIFFFVPLISSVIENKLLFLFAFNFLFVKL